MRFRFAVARVLLLIGLWLSGVGACQAALFTILYDDRGDGVLGSGAHVGTGVLSYSGAATVGSFTLSSLPDLAFSVSFGGDGFSTADIFSDLNLTGISIFDRGAGQFGLVFTGNTGGSLDLQRDLNTLSHEPTASLSSPIGCCGGDGETNLYFLSLNEHIYYFGDYAASTDSAVPAPASAALLLLGLLGLSRVKHRTVA